MPRIVDYAPAWLSRPSPGASLFSSTTKDKPASGHLRNRSDGGAQNDASYHGPLRTLARRGTEVFVVVNNQIRWAKLTALKEQWQEGVRRNRRDAANGDKRETHEDMKRPASRETEEDVDCEPQFRVLATSIYGPIKQLIPSPDGAFMAIVTPHTIHIAVLPDSCHLAGPDFSPIKLKTYQLGPTTHVIPEAPVIAALWHPLGVYDNSIGCIVTVTTDAVVRLWEIDRRNHWSFDRPTLAVDLKKLVDGTSLDQDFAPSGFGQTKGFSADSLYMEVAAACFGGHGYDEEDAWAPMTLWVAMSAGDIYALCPLLPTKWQVPSLTIPCLTTSIIHRVAAVEGESPDTDDETRAVRQQYEWLQELDTQEPLPVPPGSDFTEVRNRPANPSPVPRLQGPFQFDLEQEPDDLEITDIFVIAAKPDLESLVSEDDIIPFRGSAEEGLSATVICLATSTGVIHICLEVDGVEAQWLPKLSKGTFTSPSSEPPELILVESLETLRDKDKQIPCWPTFTEDLESRYHMLVTSAINVTHISLTSWAQRLESEFQSQDAAGSGFRVKILCEGDIAERQRLVQVSDQKADVEGNPEHFAASLLLRDYDLGYLLLTYSASGAYAIQLESPESADYPSYKGLSPFEDDSISFQPLVIASQRSPYQVSSALYAPSPLDSFIEDHVPHGHRHTLKDPMRFSPATLDIIAAAHRVLSAHTHALEKAASDLFRRCERLQGEMSDQLTHLVEIAERINDVSNGTVRGTQRRLPVGREQALDSRMDAIESRQKELLDRYNSIRTKIDRAGGRPMSDKEKIWVREIEGLSKSLGLSKAESQSQLIQRLKKALSFARELLAEAKQLSETGKEEPATPGTKAKRSSQIPERLQKARVTDAMTLVERESAMIEAITSRLDRLTTSVSGL